MTTPRDDSLPGLARALADAPDRGGVFDRLERFVAGYFASAILFEVDGTEARARFACGVPQGREGLSRVRIDVHEHPTLSDVFVRRGLFVGAEPEGQRWLTGALSIPPESLLNVLPLLTHDRVVGLLVGNARRRPCADPVKEDQALAHLVSTALSMVSMRRRLLEAGRVS